MREKLIVWLCEAMLIFDKKKDEPGINPFGVFADHLIANGVTFATEPLTNCQQWIPVTERLPTEADGTVLVCYPDVFPFNLKEPFINAKHCQRVRTGKYSQHINTWFIGDFNAVGKPDPAFWMPLPEPPKEVQE